MFTGIIEEVGTVARIERGAKSARLSIAARTVLEDTKVGDSIAVNGVCLTVTSLSPGRFTADVMHETLERSSLGSLKPGSSVNLERAVQLGGRLGGHIVSGHIDGTGTLRSIERDDTAIWYTVATKPELLRYIVEKGSIALDGISLTVARVDATGFSVSTIPHTNEETTLPDRKVGDTVNLECDVIAKYVEKLASPRETSGASEQEKPQGITMEFLAENGF
ncbi:MAG: riboflavin synthase [Coriobacteriales bacterium]|jgi:riboflavin synthase